MLSPCKLNRSQIQQQQGRARTLARASSLSARRHIRSNSHATPTSASPLPSAATPEKRPGPHPSRRSKNAPPTPPSQLQAACHGSPGMPETLQPPSRATAESPAHHNLASTTYQTSCPWAKAPNSTATASSSASPTQVASSRRCSSYRRGSRPYLHTSNSPRPWRTWTEE